jgi:hypothetical protein
MFSHVRWLLAVVDNKVLETALQRNRTQLIEQHMFPTWFPRTRKKCSVFTVVVVVVAAVSGPPSPFCSISTN